MDSFMQGNATTTMASSADATTSAPEISYITGEITTADILEDIDILSRLVMPTDFSITMTDDDSEYGYTSVTADMHLTEAMSKATFKNFETSYGDTYVKVPDFDMYMSGDHYYLNEAAMSASTTLSARIAMLLSIATEETDETTKAGHIDTLSKMSDATDELVKEAGSDQYVKLTAVEAASVPAVLMTPVSAAMVSGFFGKDMSCFTDLFEDKKDIFCKTDTDGSHVFEVNKDNGVTFFDTLLSLTDDQILMLVMIDSYDDVLWTSITDETWESLSATVQARIDAYKAHWTECRDAISAGTLDYHYKLAMNFNSDVDFEIKLEMNTLVENATVKRVIDLKTLDKLEKLELPDGSKILTSEQWEADINPLVEKHLAEFQIEDTESNTETEGDADATDSTDNTEASESTTSTESE